MDPWERTEADFAGLCLTTGPHPMELARPGLPSVACNTEGRCMWPARSSAGSARAPPRACASTYKEELEETAENAKSTEKDGWRSCRPHRDFLRQMRRSLVCNRSEVTVFAFFAILAVDQRVSTNDGSLICV